MKKCLIFIGVITTTIISGCGDIQRTSARLTGWSEVCVDGVAYLQFPSGVSVKYARDGRLAGCR